MAPPLLLAFGSCLAACGAAAGVPTGAAPPPPAEALADTAARRVQLDEGSLPFIEVAPVDALPVSSWLSAPGRVTFRDAAVARVGAPLPGRIEAVHVELGEAVQQDAPLFTIGSPDAAAMRAELASARSRIEAARLEVERQISLRDAGVGLASELVRAQSELAQAETELERARVGSRLIGRGAGGKVVVKAPIGGTVLARRATPGTVAEPGDDSLVDIGDPSALWIAVDVFEDELALVRSGARAEVHASISNEPLAATVVRVAGAVDDRTRRAPVVLALDSVPEGTRAGMFVRARIEASEQGRVSLPSGAVLIGEGGRTSVWVGTEHPDAFEAREVVVGRAVDGRVPVLAGLSPADRVVVDNALLLDAAAGQLL